MPSDYEKKRAKLEYRSWYLSTLWRSIRKQRLKFEPLCRICKAAGKTMHSKVVDHVIPHRGNRELFFSFTNTQALCFHCHNSVKQGMEHRGYSKAVGNDGWPTDPRHPSNRKTR